MSRDGVWDYKNYWAWHVYSDGYLGATLITGAGLGTRPVFYLNSDIAISEGNGSIELPYIIGN